MPRLDDNPSAWIQSSIRRTASNRLKQLHQALLALSLLFGLIAMFVDQCKNIIGSAAGSNKGVIHGGQPFKGNVLEGVAKPCRGT